MYKQYSKKVLNLNMISDLIDAPTPVRTKYLKCLFEMSCMFRMYLNKRDIYFVLRHFVLRLGFFITCLFCTLHTGVPPQKFSILKINIKFFDGKIEKFKKTQLCRL